MKTVYNISDRIFSSEPYPRVNFVKYAERNSNFTHICGRTQSHSIWRNLSCSSVLQKTESKVAFAKLCKISLLPQTLSSGRINPGYDLCFDCWYPPSEQNKDSSRQWCFSTDCRLKELSLLQQFKTFFKKSQPQNNSRYQQGSRSLKAKDVLSPKAPHQHPLRFRFLCSYPLWQVYRRSREGLQPSQKRSSFLSSFTLFRISLQRLLAWYLKTRKCLHLYRFSRVFKDMFRENPSLSLSYSSASRLRFLRSQVYRTPRRSKYWLLYCSQNDPSYQGESVEPPLSQIQEELGSCRVLLPTLSLEETTSFCSNQTTTTRKRLRTTHSLYLKTICLSDLCNQSPFEARKSLVFLQTPSIYRSSYQRTERKLCSGQDSNQQLPSQSGLFFSAPFCLQYRQLVQKALSSTEIPECYIRNYSDRVPGIAGQIGQIKEPECTQITSRIYSPTDIGSYYSEN